MSDTPEMSVLEIDALLRFYADSGLDFPVADDAINRFETVETQETARPVTPKQMSGAGRQNNPVDPNAGQPVEMDPRKRKAEEPRPVAQADTSVAIPTEEVVARAVAMSDAAQDLDALKQAVETFEGCNLKRSARSTVFEGGKRGARLMIIGGAPSRDDDVTGEAFSGADGLLLEKMLGAIGLNRHEDIYSSYCVPWSPPGGSTPTPLHLEMCAPFLARQIQLAKPALIVLLGNTATRHVLQTKQTVTQVHGRWTTLPNFGLEAVAMCDPAMLRAQPRLKRGAWMDLLSVKAKLASL